MPGRFGLCLRQSVITLLKIHYMYSYFRVIALIFLGFLTILVRPALANTELDVVLQAATMPTTTSEGISHGGTAWDDDVSVPWGLTVVLMGPMDPVQQAEIPVSEAISFIEARTRLVFDVQYVTTYSGYDYTPYRLGADTDGDGVGDDLAYLMMGWNIPPSIIDSLPVSSSYLFLHSMNGLRPLQAGSALGIDYGIRKGGKPRPYSSVPTDQWWYVNEPYGGFKSRAAQILTHEIINTIQGRIEAAPYYCPQLTATWGLDPAEFESERLLKLNDACYQKLGNNTD